MKAPKNSSIVMYAAEFVHAIHVRCMYTSPDRNGGTKGPTEKKNKKNEKPET